jgi:hypothetical protein
MGKPETYKIEVPQGESSKFLLRLIRKAAALSLHSVDQKKKKKKEAHVEFGCSLHA